MQGDKLTCLRCSWGTDPDHPWVQRKPTPPVSCPRCKSYDWTTPRLHVEDGTYAPGRAWGTKENQ